MAMRLPCPNQLRLIDDFYQDGLTQTSYTAQKQHRCLAMNPHVVSYKRETMRGKPTNQDIESHKDPRFIYNDITEFELGFAFTGLAIPNDKPKPGKKSELEPHHNTWRVPNVQEDDSMYFYAAQAMILSSMQFVHQWHNYGWLRHNHPRIELLEYQVDTPVQAIRTFPVLGIPDFFPNLPGPEELDGHKNEDWTGPVGRHIQRVPGKSGSYYEGQLTKVVRWLKTERWHNILMERRMKCTNGQDKPQPWHVIQAQHDCNHQATLDLHSQFKYPTEYSSCKHYVNPTANPGCWSSRHDTGKKTPLRHNEDGEVTGGGDIIWWYRTACGPPLPTCDQRGGSYTVWKRNRAHPHVKLDASVPTGPDTLEDARVRLRQEKQVNSHSGSLASVCPFSCTQEKLHKSYQRNYNDVLHMQNDYTPGYIEPDRTADAIREKRAQQLKAAVDGRAPPGGGGGGKHAGELNSQLDHIRVTGHSRGYSSRRGRSTHGFFHYGWNQITKKFYTCLNEAKVAAKRGAAKYDEMGRLMHTGHEWNTKYFDAGVGKATQDLPLSVWTKCKSKATPNPLPTLTGGDAEAPHTRRTGSSWKPYPWQEVFSNKKELGEDKSKHYEDEVDPLTVNGSPEEKAAKELHEKKVAAEKKRRARLAKDAMIKQQIMAEIEAGKSVEIKAKTEDLTATKTNEVKEKNDLIDCELAEEIPYAQKCYDTLREAIKKKGDRFNFYGPYSRDDPNVHDNQHTMDWIAAHEKCVESRSHYRMWECQRMFEDGGPGEACRKKDSADCEAKDDCGRTWDCAANQKYTLKRTWTENCK